MTSPKEIGHGCVKCNTVGPLRWTDVCETCSEQAHRAYFEWYTAEERAKKGVPNAA